jgi:hypothetical protein
MSLIFDSGAVDNAQIVDLVTQEREKSLSPREWIHRLAGMGYGIRDTENGQIIETLPHRVPVCQVPVGLTA